MLIRFPPLYVGGVIAIGTRILLPELTGPHQVGLTHLEVVDESRADPFAPEPATPRDLMVTLFYPIAAASTADSSDGSALAPQFAGPATASYIDALLRLPEGTAERLTTRARHYHHLDVHGVAAVNNNNSTESSPLPLILFSHGFGFTRGLYSALLSELASWGWAVAAVDHPHDAGIVEYPDGRAARRPEDWTWPLDPGVRERALDARVRDLLCVLARLGNASAAIDTSSVAALGHSFGGAAAVQMLRSSGAVAAAADLDGFLYGPVVRHGTRKPTLVLGFPEHLATDDPDAPAEPGWPALRGWKADFTVAGAVHESFSDYPVLADVLGPDGPGGDAYGTVGGRRMLRIMRTYVGAFFARFVLGLDDDDDDDGGGGGGGGGEGGLLDGNTSAFPEVRLRRKGAGQQEEAQWLDIKQEL